jgi:AraC-like DNA-binding protein
MIFGILNMTPWNRDYFVYLSSTPERSRWGVEVLGAGFTRIAPAQPYPAPGHPSHHHFDYEKGRTLEALQILFVTGGRGSLETRSRGRQKILPGSVVFLLPGEWHRYRPDPKSGWTEHWVELDGWVVRSLIEAGTFTARQCLFHAPATSGIEEHFESLHPLVSGRRAYSIPDLAHLAHRLLGCGAEFPNAGKSLSRISGIVRRAEEQLGAPPVEKVDLEALARKLGVGYSYFRRIFREQTGLSPWQYLIKSRLARARRILASGEDSLSEIAEAVGFGSAFHFSAAFKKAHRVSPDTWRKQFKKKPASR